MATGIAWLVRQSKREYFWLVIMVVVTLVLHFIIITYPNEPIFDEQHYVPDARQIIAGQGTRTPEHPSFAKLFIVSGIQLFGDNGVGWRFFSIIAGAASIWLFFLICRKLKMSRRAVNLATFVFAFESLFFVVSSVAMLDIYTLAMALLALWLYARGSYYLAGAAIALCTVAKVSGILIAPVIGLHWLLVRRDKPWEFTGLVAMVPLGVLVFMIGTDYLVFHSFQNPILRFRNMSSQMASLTFVTAKHPSMSRPWDWVIQPLLMPYWYIPHYLATYSYSLWLVTLPLTGYMIYRARWKSDDVSMFGVCWFFGAFVIWVPISLITNRISFIFYFMPAVGAMCIGAGIVLNQLWDVWKWNYVYPRQRYGAMAVVIIFIFFHLAVFGFLNPLNNLWQYPIPPAEPTTTSSLLSQLRWF